MPDPSKLTKPAVVSVPSADKPQHRPEKRPLLGPIAQGVGLLSVVFALFGHGVLIGIATPLQLDPGMLVNSPFDLLMACWKGVVMIMTLGAKKTASEMVWELGAQQLWPVLIAMAAVVMFFLVKPYWPRLSQWLQAKSEAICHVSKDQWWSDRNLWIALGFVGLWGVFSVLVPLLLLGGLAGLIIMLPGMGYSAGAAYVKQYVIDQPACVLVGSSSTRPEDLIWSSEKLQEGCVRVTSIPQKMDPDRVGRLVHAGPAYVILYDKNAHVAERVPIANARVAAVVSDSRKPHAGPISGASAPQRSASSPR